MQKSYIQKLYTEYFLKKYRRKGYKFSNKIFSSEEVLNCLEQELDSYIHIDEFIRKYLKINPKSILILGPGSGKLGSTIRQIYPNSKIIELDINQFVIKRLKKRFESDANRIPIIGSATNIPLTTNSVDFILGYSVLRYIENHEKVVSEIYRVLKQQGTILLGEGKNENTITKVSNFFIKASKKIKFHTMMNINLPNLSYFYYLIDNLDKNSYIEKEISLIKKTKNISVLDALFLAAGISSDCIYLLEANYE